MTTIEQIIYGYLPYFEQIMNLNSPNADKLLNPQSFMDLTFQKRPLQLEEIHPDYYPNEKIVMVKYIRQTRDKKGRNTFFMHCLLIPLAVLVELNGSFPVSFNGVEISISIRNIIEYFGQYIIRNPEQVTGTLQSIVLK